MGQANTEQISGIFSLTADDSEMQLRFYNTKYDAKSPEFWSSIELPNRPDKEYVCIGVKASNYFMPKDTLSEKGPGGGGWILMVVCSDRKILAEFFGM